jgi:hypothetical protein
MVPSKDTIEQCVSANAKKLQCPVANFPYFFSARGTIPPLLEEDTARARGIKSVILALRYFSATAGDAQRERRGGDEPSVHEMRGRKAHEHLHRPGRVWF